MYCTLNACSLDITLINIYLKVCNRLQIVGTLHRNKSRCKAFLVCNISIVNLLSPTSQTSYNSLDRNLTNC